MYEDEKPSDLECAQIVLDGGCGVCFAVMDKEHKIDADNMCKAWDLPSTTKFDYHYSHCPEKFHRFHEIDTEFFQNTDDPRWLCELYPKDPF